MARTMDLGFATYRAFGPPGWSPPSLRDVTEAIAEGLGSRHAWALLAEVAGEPAGHVALRPDPRDADTAYLWQLFVRPRWFGAGLAARLHDAFAEEAVARGYRAGRLVTPAQHARARRFYEHRGWRPAAPPGLMAALGIPVVEYRCRLVR